MSTSEKDPNAAKLRWQGMESARKYLAARTGATSAAFFLPHLQPGMDLLDCGCAEGSITADLATTVAPGQATGIDIREAAIDGAREMAERRGLTNLRFEACSVYELPFEDNSFDAVFSHALFEYLREPALALREIQRVLRPGGVVGLRAPIENSHTYYPQEPLLDEWAELFRRIRKAMGVDDNVGRKLAALLHETGFSGVQVNVTFQTYTTPDQIQLWAEVLSGAVLDSDFAVDILERGWADQKTLERISAALTTWAQQPGAFVARAWGEAVGFVDS